MKRLFLFLSMALFFYTTNLMAEEFVVKRASIEKNGQVIEVDKNELKGLPPFHADYQPNDGIVKIRCSAGNLILKKGIFFYGYSGMHKGLHITARAYVENGNLDQITYEEWDKSKNAKVILHYYKK